MSRAIGQAGVICMEEGWSVITIINIVIQLPAGGGYGIGDVVERCEDGIGAAVLDHCPSKRAVGERGGGVVRHTTIIELVGLAHYQLISRWL
jgi:hypothetical protein